MNMEQQLPGHINVSTPFTREQVEAGDYPEGETATGTRVEPDGSIWTFEVPLADTLGITAEGARIRLESYRLDPDDIPRVVSGYEKVLGEVATINDGRRRGGRASRRLVAVQNLVDQLVAEYADRTATQIWELIPESRDPDAPVYRDGKKLVAVDDRTGGERQSPTTPSGAT